METLRQLRSRESVVRIVFSGSGHGRSSRRRRRRRRCGGHSFRSSRTEEDFRFSDCGSSSSSGFIGACFYLCPPNSCGTREKRAAVFPARWMEKRW